MIEIVDWDKNYENNRTRDLKQMQWVPMPNRHDGDGYTQLLDHQNGTAHFGAWCALVQVASRCGDGAPSRDNPSPRGVLMRRGGLPHNSDTLSRMTRIPKSIWDEVLPRLLKIGWITGYKIPQEGATFPQEDAVIPQEGALKEGRKGRNGKKENIDQNFPEIDADASIVQADLESYHIIEKAFLSHNGEKFTDYGKEGKALHGLIAKAKARDSDHWQDLLSTVCTAFWKLKQSNDKFWIGQPFLPSSLNASGIWDRVLESMRRDELDPEIEKLIRSRV